MAKNFSQQTFVFIESNTTGTGYLFFETARKKGYKTLFLTTNPFRYNFLANNFIHPIIIDTENRDDVLDYLSRIDNLAGIFSSSEYFIETAAYCATQLGLPGTDPEIIALCRNKRLLVKTLDEKNISVPKSYHLDGGENFNIENFSQLQYPVVIKPIHGTGSIDVKLCRDEIESKDFLNYLHKKSVPALIQTYIDGDEYSIESIGLGTKIEILGVTKKYLGAPPHFLETGHDFPASLPQKIHDELCHFLITTLETLNFNFGPAHTEIRIKDKKPYLIEINPRLAGGMIPELVKIATGVDLIESIIDLCTGKNINLTKTKSRFASIRFLIPPKPGLITNIENHNQVSNAAIETFFVNKEIGDSIEINGNFKDRIGYVIASGDSKDESIHCSESFTENINITIQSLDNNSHHITDSGILKQTLHPTALSIINKVYKPIADFHYYAKLDEAHLIMLLTSKVLSREIVSNLLCIIRKLKQENFSALDNQPMPRGSYFLYEQAIISQVGISVGGNLHVARSRNDINATIFKLRSREIYCSLYEALWQLRSTLVQRAALAQKTPLPIYSQYQTTLPGTLGFYLLGIEEALLRDQKALQDIFKFLLDCPLGCGAGSGTSFPIQPNITAQFLGFEKPSQHALDAIASRDLALRILAWANIVGMNLSRITEDLHLWSTNEFGFISFPDNLCGSSSMMPQKRNPYLLEIIKGKVMSLSGNFIASISLMCKVPFGNSVEVGTEAVRNFYQALHSLMDAMNLLRLLIEAMVVNSEKTRAAVFNNLTIATCISEILVKEQGNDHKTAHHRVGETIHNAVSQDLNPLQSLLDLVPTITNADSVTTWTNLMCYGAGADDNTMSLNLNRANSNLFDDQNWLSDKQEKFNAAEKTREEYVDSLIESSVK